MMLEEVEMWRGISVPQYSDAKLGGEAMLTSSEDSRIRARNTLMIKEVIDKPASEKRRAT